MTSVKLINHSCSTADWNYFGKSCIAFLVIHHKKIGPEQTNTKKRPRSITPGPDVDA